MSVCRYKFNIWNKFPDLTVDAAVHSYDYVTAVNRFHLAACLNCATYVETISVKFYVHSLH